MTIKVEVLNNGGSCTEIRAENDINVFIAKYDSYYKDQVISLQIINKRSAQMVQPVPQHYYELGCIVTAHAFETIERSEND